MRARRPSRALFAAARNALELELRAEVAAAIRRVPRAFSRAHVVGRLPRTTRRRSRTS